MPARVGYHIVEVDEDGSGEAACPYHPIVSEVYEADEVYEAQWENGEIVMLQVEHWQAVEPCPRCGNRPTFD